MEAAAHRPSSYSQTSLEERILQNHYSDLHQGIAHPLSVATQLVQKRVVDMALVSKLTTPAMSCLQQNAAILSAVNSSVHNNPSHFQVLLSVLEDTAESATLARKMRRELSAPETSVDSQQMTGQDRCYFIADHYKKDYVRLKAEYGSMFKYVQEKVKDSVSVDELKQYLCQYDELESLLQDADTMVEVMNAVRRQSTLTDYAYIAEIAHHFGIDEAKSKIGSYRKTLDDFCQHTVQNHTYVQSFCKDRSKPIPSSNKVTFKIEWDAAKTTMNDIHGILRMAFGHLADRVEILVVREGCVLLECAAPQYLMNDLVGVAMRRKNKLVAMDVVKLTIGSTEVINEQCTSEYWESDRQDLSCGQPKLEKYAGDNKAADKNAKETQALVSTQPLLSLLVIMLMLNIFLVPLSFICIEQAGANCRPDAILFSNIANAALFSNLTTTSINPVLHSHQLVYARSQSYNHQLVDDVIPLNQSYNHSSNSILISNMCTLSDIHKEFEWNTTVELFISSDVEGSYRSICRLNDCHLVHRSLFNRSHQICVNTSKACGQLQCKLNTLSILRHNYFSINLGASLSNDTLSTFRYSTFNIKFNIKFNMKFDIKFNISTFRYGTFNIKLNTLSTLRHNFSIDPEAWLSTDTLSTFRYGISGEYQLSIDKPKWNTLSIMGLHITSTYLEQLSIGRPTPRIMRLNISICVEGLSIRLGDSHWVCIRLFDCTPNQSSCTTHWLLANYTMVDIPIKVTARTN